MEYQPNFKRQENILILPHNTLRMVDAMFQLEVIKNLTGKIPDFEENLYKCVCRVEKDLSKIFNIPDELLKKFNDNWYYYWNIAPRTKVYEYIQITASQKFTDNVTVLFSDKRAKDDIFASDYYDGTIEGLEEYIVKNKVTAVVIDDLDILMQLTRRKKINLNNLSFMISRVGYNYEWDKMLNMVMPKRELYEAEKKSYIEVGMVSLYEFPKELIKRLNGGKK